MKKKLFISLLSVLSATALIAMLVCFTSCDKKDVATPDEAIVETKIETVTEIATDEQGSTFIEEATKVVEVKVTEETTEPTEKETKDNNKLVAENASESSKTTSDNSSKTNTSNDKSSSSNVKSESTSKNSSTNKNTSSNNSSSATTSKNNSSSTANKNNSSSSSATSKPTAKPTPKPTSPNNTTSNKTWHEAEYEYINHPAVTEKVWVVDKEAYTYEEPIYEKQGRAICNDCGADITDDIYNHSKNHALNGGNGSYSVKKISVQVGTKTVTVPEEGHWETKTIKEAWTEKKLVREAGYY